MKVREITRRLKRGGCAMLRQRGSHQTWITPSGRKFTLVVHSQSHELSHRDVNGIDEIFREEGINA